MSTRRWWWSGLILLAFLLRVQVEHASMGMSAFGAFTFRVLLGAVLTAGLLLTLEATAGKDDYR